MSCPNDFSRFSDCFSIDFRSEKVFEHLVENNNMLKVRFKKKELDDRIVLVDMGNDVLPTT